MSLMTREDMLRELELLPAWQLRVPLPSQTLLHADTSTLNLAKDLPINIDNIEQAEVFTTLALDGALVVEKPVVETLESAKSQVFTHITSEDGDYLFVLTNVALQVEEAQLMQNICSAMHLHVQATQMSVITVDVIQADRPKLIIAMGEATAQALLQTTEVLASLRGKLHQFQGIALVTTYDLTHLLQNLPDKAKAWDDLRFAMQTLQGFKL